MRTVFEEQAAQSREIERTLMQGDARLCSPVFGRVCKAIWPVKTSECLAAAAGYKSARTAAYEIAGEREPSSRSLVAVINEIARRH